MRRPINWITVCLSITFLVLGLSMAEPRRQHDSRVVEPVAVPVLSDAPMRADLDLDLVPRRAPYAYAPLASDASKPTVDSATLSYSITFETAEPLDVRELTAALEPRHR
jgi:hypothetical protein